MFKTLMSFAVAVAAASAATPVAAQARWQPGVQTSWQIQLQGAPDTSYDVQAYDLDLFDTPQTVFDALHAAGRHVICYFSAGSAEHWRPDYGRFLPSDLGNPLSGWPGERWVDTRSANVRAIVAARLDLALSRGCDAVDPDNVDGYTQRPGFPLTPATQLDYNRFLADQAHARGLAVGLKNDVGQLADLAPWFEFAVNEQCHEYAECDGYATFTSAGKPAFNVEYKALWVRSATRRARMCAQAQAQSLRTLVLPLALDNAFRLSCD